MHLEIKAKAIKKLFDLLKQTFFFSWRKTSAIAKASAPSTWEPLLMICPQIPFSHLSSLIFTIQDEPFSDDDPFDFIDDDSDLIEGTETVTDNHLKSMGSVEIYDVVNEVNQKIIQGSKKVTNLQNPIKVLVRISRFRRDGLYNFIMKFI